MKRHLSHINLVILCLLFSVGCVLGQNKPRVTIESFKQQVPKGTTDVIDIKVVDSLTNEELPFAQITIASPKDSVMFIDRENWQTLRKIRYKDSVDIQVQYIGYHTLRERINFYMPSEITIRMSRKQVQAAEVIVRGDDLLFLVKKDTIIYNASKFKNFEGETLGSIFAKAPGILFKNGKLTYLGKPIERIYIDDTRLFENNVSEALGRIRADDVVKIKVFDEHDDWEKLNDIKHADKITVANVITKSKPKMIRSQDLSAGFAIADNKTDNDEYTKQWHLSGGITKSRPGENYGLSALAVNQNSQYGGIDSRSITLGYEKHEVNKIHIKTDLFLKLGDEKSVTFTDRQYNQLDMTESDYLENNRDERSGVFLARGYKTFKNKTKLDFTLQTTLEDLKFNNLNSTKTLLNGQDFKNTHLEKNSTEERLRILLNLSHSLYFAKPKITTTYGANIKLNGGDISDVVFDTLQSSSDKVYLDRTADENMTTIEGYFKLSKNLFKILNWGLNLQYFDDRSRKERMAFDVITTKLDTAGSYNFDLVDQKFNINTSLGLNISKNTTVNIGVSGKILNQEYTDLIPYTYSNSISKFIPSYSLSFRTQYKMWMFSTLNISKSKSVPFVTSFQDRIIESTPYSLSAGNPNLKMVDTYNITGQINILTYNLGTFSADIMLSFANNATASISKVFTEDTYLPEYGYKARKGAILTTTTNAGKNRFFNLETQYSKFISSIESSISLSYKFRYLKNPYIKDEEVLYRNNSTHTFTVRYSGSFSRNLKPSINYTLMKNINEGNGPLFSSTTGIVSISNRVRLFKRVSIGFTGYYRYLRNTSAPHTNEDIFNLSADSGFNLFKKRLGVSVHLDNIFDNNNNYSVKSNIVYSEVIKRISLGRKLRFSLSWKFKNDSSLVQ